MLAHFKCTTDNEVLEGLQKRVGSWSPGSALRAWAVRYSQNQNDKYSLKRERGGMACCHDLERPQMKTPENQKNVLVVSEIPRLLSAC